MRKSLQLKALFRTNLIVDKYIFQPEMCCNSLIIVIAEFAVVLFLFSSPCNTLRCHINTPTYTQPVRCVLCRRRRLRRFFIIFLLMGLSCYITFSNIRILLERK